MKESLWLTVLQLRNCSSVWALGFDWRCHHCQRSGLAGWHAAGWVQRAGKRGQRTGCRRVWVVHRHAADDVGALTQADTGQTDGFPWVTAQTGSIKWVHKSESSSPGRMELPLILCVSVAVNGDDAHGWAGRVGDYDGLGHHYAGGGRGYIAAAEKRCSGYTSAQIWKGVT